MNKNKAKRGWQYTVAKVEKERERVKHSTKGTLLEDREITRQRARAKSKKFLPRVKNFLQNQSSNSRSAHC